MPTNPKCPKLSPISEDDSSLVFPFTEEEYKMGIAILKNKKVAGIDDVLVEQLINLGLRAYRLLHSMLNVCFTENRIPKVWRQSKIIAILKPGKDAAIPKCYRPISLLCHIYKLYERLLLNRIAPSVDRHLMLLLYALFNHPQLCVWRNSRGTITVEYSIVRSID